VSTELLFSAGPRALSVATAQNTWLPLIKTAGEAEKIYLHFTLFKSKMNCVVAYATE